MTEEEIKEENKILKQIVENIPEAIIVANRKAKIVRVNAYAEIMFGYTKEELLNGTIQMLMIDAITSSHNAKYDAWFDSPKKIEHACIKNGEHYLIAKHKDGSTIPVVLSLSPLIDGDETLVVACIRDIAILKETQDHLKRKIDQLEQRDTTLKALRELIDISEKLNKNRG